MFKTLPSIDNFQTAPTFSTPRIFVLRLKPLDKGKEVALLVEREERLSRHEGEVTEASLSFHYQVVSDEVLSRQHEGGEFSASYDAWILGRPHVRLTSTSIAEGGYCVVDPDWLAGRGLGTFFMNEIVRWVQQWPEAHVMPVKLLASDAQRDNKRRRNRFYENFGLAFEYEDERRVAGQSAPMLSRELTPLTEEKQQALGNKLEVCSLNRYLSEHAQEKEALELERRGLKGQLDTSSHDLERAYSNPFRWAITTAVSKFVRGY
nr:hypothetical protein [uncultured Halomonas sp.]